MSICKYSIFLLFFSIHVMFLQAPGEDGCDKRLDDMVTQVSASSQQAGAFLNTFFCGLRGAGYLDFIRCAESRIAALKEYSDFIQANQRSIPQLKEILAQDDFFLEYLSLLSNFYEALHFFVKSSQRCLELGQSLDLEHTYVFKNGYVDLVDWSSQDVDGNFGKQHMYLAPEIKSMHENFDKVILDLKRLQEGLQQLLQRPNEQSVSKKLKTNDSSHIPLNRLCICIDLLVTALEKINWSADSYSSFAVCRSMCDHVETIYNRHLTIETLIKLLQGFAS